LKVFSCSCVIKPQKGYKGVKSWRFNTMALSVDIRQNFVNIETHVKSKSAIQINRNSYHALLKSAAHTTLRDDRLGVFSPYKLVKQLMIDSTTYINFFSPHYDVFSYFRNVICGPQSQLIVYSLKINVYLNTQSAD
jgi:hypothetical protein